MTITHANRNFSRAATSSSTHSPSTLPGRRSPKTGRPATIIASTTADTHQAARRRDRTPEENLWLAVFSSIHHDARRNLIYSSDFEFQESCRLDFVAWALGWPTDSLPCIFRSAAEERAQSRRKGMKLVEVLR